MRILVSVFCLLLSLPLWAHSFTLTETHVAFRDGFFQIEMRCDLDALALGVPQESDDQALYDALSAKTPEELAELKAGLTRHFERRIRVRFDDQPVPFNVVLAPEARFATAEVEAEAAVPSFLGTLVRFEGTVPAESQTFSFFASRSFPAVKLIFVDAPAEAQVVPLPQGARSEPLAFRDLKPPGAATVFGRYTVLGFLHILPKGLDHILFVLGLFLLCNRRKPLLIMVTGFTLAHSLTLALSVLGIVQLPSRPVEILIALSICYVAIEVALGREYRMRHTLVVFAFGLLHGLGFAGVLTELGLPEGQLVLALFAFNIGVELGQIAVLVGAFAVFGWWRAKAFYEPYLVRPASVLIGCIGLFWVVERFIG
ncbi:HupE/UreJ family protein [Acanthopleuribacter pedis]|uniref:HupE/UreJ family protein n=1 Tax=Acanthopleuribacter pedis TaxID=442870 RepID=A0A8J7QFQ7_9BACT|nr:HupE/UreJ family protein [Acanthopleuribacter pedis]MBO1317635.1 HupE/UreJ family protein [Acanthopleuribacter pedis]